MRRSDLDNMATGNKFDFTLLENADSLMLPYLMAKAAIDLVIPVISQEHLV